MEKAIGISIPVLADSVLSPDVLYADAFTGIYFSTEDEQYGRITFENLDALKICRGEVLPYPYQWQQGEKYPWVYKIEQSTWLKERFDYENKNYGSAYEFGGNVNDMCTDFKHYVFQFHDQFVEVIARGFWFEQDEKSLFKRELQADHPFLNLSDQHMQTLECHHLTCQIRINGTAQEKLITDAKFCSQKLMEFALEIDGKASVDHVVQLFYRNGKLISCLRGYFGNQIIAFDGIATLADVKPYIEKYMQEVYERRKAMGK